MQKVEKQFPNLWELTPERNAQWETAEEEKIVVLVPKFRNPFLAKWLMPYLSKPYFRIKLDSIGSAIWQQCDGQTPVLQIAELLKEKFGAGVDPVDERINRFLHQLERGDLVVLHQKNK